MGAHPGLRPQLVPKELVESPASRQPATPTFHAARGDTVLITVAVDRPLLSRSVAIQWHGTSEIGTAPAAADGVDGHTFTYNFVADRPGTFTYRARYGRNRAATFTDAQGREAWPSAAGGTAAGHGVRVPRSHEGKEPSAGSGAANVPRRDADREIVYVRRGRNNACVEAQLMAGNPVIYLNEEYPVERLLRWSAAGLTAAILWVAGVCGGRRRDPVMPMRRRQGDGPLTVRCGGPATPHVSRAPSFPAP